MKREFLGRFRVKRFQYSEYKYVDENGNKKYLLTSIDLKENLYSEYWFNDIQEMFNFEKRI